MRIIPASSPTGNKRHEGYVPRRTPRDAARDAAIESSRSHYIPLICGHVTTMEVHLLMKYARPRKGVTYCETCEYWVEIEKPPQAAPLEDVPLF